MSASDSDLMRRWLHGEAAAFETLVRRWEKRIARFVARLVGRFDLVPDLCQEVFLRLFLARDKYRESGQFSTWLYQIALNAARDALRRQRHGPQPLEDCDPVGETDVAGRTCERREIADAVSAALADLPAHLREVLVLRHYEDMRFEEMARLLGTPASTLKSRFAVALGRLRVKLEHLDWRHEEKR